jgi:NAD(P)-dependent dehydrogenase (short-subunit alcohol dehydrogenase family)
VSFEGKIALVTGAESGIGLATAERLVDAGTAVVLAGLDAERGRDAAATLSNEGRNTHFVAVDVRVEESVAELFDTVEDRFSGLDFLVNSAGVNAVGTVDVLSTADWDNCFDTNARGAFLTSRLALPLMRRRGGGAIVNVASNAALVARGRDPVYAASKAALLMLTRAMAVHHAGEGIRVNAVCPGPVANTRLMDAALSSALDPDGELLATMEAAPLTQWLHRLIEPSEVADAILFLLSSPVATGAALAIDAGKSAGVRL